MPKVCVVTNSTPPGWHPDPGHTGDGPRQERWWDGTAWSGELRPAPPGAWGPPGAPPYPALPPAPARSTGRRVIVGVTATVVALAIAGGFYLLGRDTGGHGSSDAAGNGSPRADAPSRPGERSPAPDGQGGGGSGGGSAAPQVPTEDGYATDAASGISIPVPDGWTGESGVLGAQITTGKYTCPGDAEGSCVRGGVNSAPAAALENTEKTAKASAEKDISANAEESYGGDVYGISSHEELKSEAVTVAGQKGYLVRWKVTTSKGDDGYVQSVVFPSPSTPNLLVVVRSGFDINDKAPKLSVMDEITKGIKVAKISGTGNGRGV